jgi:DNA invertase Pin-like site-specific DNA recombinase
LAKSLSNPLSILHPDLWYVSTSFDNYRGKMLIGYARISQDSQSIDLQIDALTAAGCEKTFSDTMSGSRNDRPGLNQALDFARSGDSICVWRLDRLGRTLSHLIQLMQDLERRGVGFRSLTEAIDTTTPGGRLTYNLFGSLAEFERSIVRERTRAGLQAARQRGRFGGRPRSVTGEKFEAARRLLDAGTSVRDVAAALGVSAPTIYRHFPASQRLTPPDGV